MSDMTSFPSQYKHTTYTHQYLAAVSL